MHVYIVDVEIKTFLELKFTKKKINKLLLQKLIENCQKFGKNTKIIKIM